MQIEARDLSVRDINRAIQAAIEGGQSEITVREPAARHNLGVGLDKAAHIIFGGSVGYYCGGLVDGARITVDGGAGWGVGESKTSGDILVRGGAGNAAGAAMSGGSLTILGDSGARAGASMQGGTLLIGGSCGYATGYAARGGTIIVCGDGGEALADSMGETQIFIGGDIANLGHGAKIVEPSSQDLAMLASTCSASEVAPRGEWKKIISTSKPQAR